jgi:acetate kinase
VSRSLLALNVGSASLKAAGYVLSGGSVEREIGRFATDEEHGTPTQAPDSILSAVAARLPALGEPDLIVHRIVHGGDHSSPLLLTTALLDELEALASLAPLHQPPALALARAARQLWASARHYGAFDTAWHLSMPDHHRLLPLPIAFYDQGIRRYGFHGLAFQSAMRQLENLAPELTHGRIVLAHLGGGSSLCAVRDGQCVNTTMGMTPLGGIAMSTRPGSLDPGVILHLQRHLGIPPADLDRLLWKESGLKGLSDESGDMRVLLASPSKRAMRAIDVYVAGVAQGIAAMGASIGGIDALTFSGGIGMHAPSVRANIVGALEWLGVQIEDNPNEQGAVEISRRGGRIRTFVLPVDEEFEMADAVGNLVESG